MKQHYIATIILLLISVNAVLQAEDKAHTWLCTFTGEKMADNDIDNIRTARPEVIKAIELITQQIGIEPNFSVFAADFNHNGIAFAAIRDNQRIIVYDAKKFDIAYNQIEWQNLFILAHEVAHHINGHTAVDNNTPHKQELDADYFGGWIAAKLGASMKQALSAANQLNKRSSETHPGRKLRKTSIEQGWQNGQSN